MLGATLGRRAMLLGALAQSIPDIDFLAALWSNTSEALLAHRGFTHSIFFALITTAGFAFLAEHFHKKHKIGFYRWVMFFAVQLGIHLFIDIFNNYGVGLFEPFSHKRISFNALFVADPLFSIWPAIAFIILLLMKPFNKKRRYWWKFGVVCSAAYLAICIINKEVVDHSVKKILANQGVPHHDFITTPTPLNNLLWYVVVNNDSEYYIGFKSVFDSKQVMYLRRFPKNDFLLKGVVDREELQHLIRFSQGYYTVEKWHDTLVFNDLRFGQMIGWHDPAEHFVFHYYIRFPDAANRLVVQRGRFANWNLETTRSLWNRIRGN